MRKRLRVAPLAGVAALLTLPLVVVVTSQAAGHTSTATQPGPLSFQPVSIPAPTRPAPSISIPPAIPEGNVEPVERGKPSVPPIAGQAHSVAKPKPRPRPKPVVRTVARSAGLPSVADARNYARSRLSATEWSCLDALWTRESSWNPHATNPSTGAYGIPQALPGSKMGSVASDWRDNPVTQVRWGLGYIASAYGTACSAWSHSQRYGWY